VENVGTDRSAELRQAEAALLRGDWQAARSGFEAAVREQPDEPNALDGLGSALFWLNQLDQALRFRERAYVAFVRDGLLGRAAWLARWLAMIYWLAYENEAAANGWAARSARLLEETGPCPELAQIKVLRSMAGGDWNVVLRDTEEAIELAHAFNNPDCEIVAIAYSGLALASMGRVPEGMARLDEAMAAATGGEMRNLEAIGWVYCAMLTACERFVDYTRATQWCQVTDSFVARYQTSPMSGSCRACYGGVLTATGRWTEAERELRLALDAFETAQVRGMRVDALVRLAELRFRQGRLDEAQQLLEGFEAHPDAAATRAGLHLARGKPGLAKAVLDRRLNELGPRNVQAVPILRRLAHVTLGQGDLPAAQATLDYLAQLAATTRLAYVEGIAELVHAEILHARHEDPVPHFETALHHLLRADMPLESGEARLGLAEALAQVDPEVALAEARSALTVFQQLGAAPHADWAAAVLRRLGEVPRTGPKVAHQLSEREREVLRLIGLGLSNEQIARQLVISRRTAEHHVGSILSKLGLTNRAEVAAYAARHPVPRTPYASR
jgi:DNA-binding CsgD family transcriptional regulator